MTNNDPSRRDWLKSTAALGLVASGSASFAASARAVTIDASQLIDIGSRRELFIDNFMIDRLEGKAEQRLHHPVPREVALVHD